MKKNKRLSALIIASIMTAGTVSSLSAGARGYGNTKKKLDEIFEDAFMIPVDSFLSGTDSEWYKNKRTYIVETEKDNVFEFYAITSADPDYISASLDVDIDTDALTEAIKKICPNAELIEFSQPEQVEDTRFRSLIIKGMNDSKERHLPYDEVRKKDITFEQAVEIYDFLNETGNLQSFQYNQVPVYYGMTRCPLTNYRYGSNKMEKIQNYIAENNLNWTIEFEDYCEPIDADTMFFVSTGQRLSAEENFKLVEQIAEELDFGPEYTYPAKTSVCNGFTIDMHNNIKGDANDDGNLALSDAITIMQTVGNPDEYQLTAQGEYNADIAGDFDGITNLDALTIQRRLLNLE